MRQVEGMWSMVSGVLGDLWSLMSVTGAAARASSCRCNSEGKGQVVDVNVSDKCNSEGKQWQPNAANISSRASSAESF